MHATSVWTWLATGTSLIASLGSLYMSIGMGLRGCPLCFYQRSFVMAVFAVLFMGLLSRSAKNGLLSLLCLPIAAGGVGVGVFHCLLEYRGILECPMGIGGIGSAPQQGLAIQVLLLLLLILDVIQGRFGIGFVLIGLVLGGGLAYGSVRSAPPLPPVPPAPYPTGPDICRPPYVVRT